MPVAARKPLPFAIVAVFAVVLIAARALFDLFAGPLPDEAYYWLWGQHPDWSYFDHPALQAWLQWAIFHIFGASLFALRVPALLTTTVLIGCLLWWVKRLRGDGIGMRPSEALLATFASPLVFVFTAMTFNDHLLLALLALASVFLRTTLDAVSRDGRPALPALYGAALAAGLAMLTKYNAGLYVLGVVPVLCFPRYRPVWRSPHLYVAVLLALACLVPIGIWNLAHAGASLRYNLVDREALASLPDFVRGALTFAVGFLASLSPFLVVPLVRLLAQRAPRSPWQPVATTIFLVSTIACVAVSAVTFVLYYWNIVSIAALFPLLAAYIRTRWGLVLHLGFGAICAVAFAVNYAVLPLAALGGHIDSESGLTYDWPAIAATAKADLATTGAQFLAASDYRHGAILAFAAGDPDVEVFSDRESQFDFWRDDAALAGKDAVIVTDLWHPMSQAVRQHFASLTGLGGHDVARFGRILAHYDFWLGKSYRP